MLLENEKSGKEKIFRMYEEWNGVALINEKTTYSLLGRIQQKLKKFIGQMAAEGARRGWY